MEEQRKSENALVPALRFEGFSDPWEQRTFDEFVYASGSRNADNLDLESHSVSNTSGFVPQSEQFENGGTMAEADKTAYWIVEPGSFAYNPARINVGSIGYLATRENVIVSSLYEVFRSDETCDDRFLWHWLKSALFAKQIEALQEGGVRLYFFFDKLLKSEITMPSIREQSIIGSLFDRLDSLIALHQRKHEKLKTVKQSLLEKMFPKEGEDVPEIRFEGFTDPWEQRKLGEICEGLSYGVGAAAVPFDGATRYLRITDIDDETHQFLEDDLSSPDPSFSLSDTDYLRPGEIVFARTGASVGKTYLNRDDAGDIVFAGFLIRAVLQEGNNPEFVYQQTLSESYKNYVAITSQRSGQPGVNAQEYSEWILWICDKDEQARIGALFRKLDSLIALHQHELDILKNLKQALLEKMFV